MAKNQDDALQILEQIVPYFQPEYTVTVKESVSDLLKTDIPITLSSIDMTEDYEGDFMSRRAIIYTLSFDAKVRFYGPERKTGVIKRVIVKTLDIDTPTNGFEIQKSTVNPIGAQSSSEYEIIEEIDYYNLTPTSEVTVYPLGVSGNAIEFVVGESITGAVSGSNGIFESITGTDELRIRDMNGTFNPDETIVGSISGAKRMVKTSSNFFY